MTLVEQLDALHDHYCTGPCGQSSSVMKARERTRQVLRAASVLVEQDNTEKLQQMERENAELLELLRACAGLLSGVSVQQDTMQRIVDKLSDVED